MLETSVRDMLQGASDSFYMFLTNACPNWQAHYSASDCFSHWCGIPSMRLTAEFIEKCGKSTRIEGGSSDTCSSQASYNCVPRQLIYQYRVLMINVTWRVNRQANRFE